MPVTRNDLPVEGLDLTAQLAAAHAALRSERARSGLLEELSAALLGSLDVVRCARITAELAAAHLADAATVVLPASRGRHATVSVVRGARAVQAVLTGDVEDAPGLEEALLGFPPVPSRWLDARSTPEWLVPDGMAPVGSVVVVPLPGHGTPAGALVLLRAVGGAAFDEDDERVALQFAGRAGLAVSAAQLHDRQTTITDTLMRELLPPRVDRLPGFDFAARYRASGDHERIGGDFYDVHPAEDPDGETLVVLGDVCGKGLEAAVLTGKIRTTLRALQPLAANHLGVLSLLNTALLSTDTTRFVTLALASVRRVPSGVHLRLTCGGHLPPLIVRADGSVEEAPTRGTLIGALPRVTASTASVTLAPGDTCLLYTDGITEAVGGPFGDEVFGEDRLASVLAECGGMPADALVERVQMLASDWIGTRDHDDMAVLAITAPRGRHLRAVGGHGRGRYTR